MPRATHTGRRRLYPMPVEAILDHPEFPTLNDVGAGMLFRLASHYWQTECRPLPAADYELRNVCRSHPAAWRRLKPVVMRIWEAAKPALDAYYQRRVSGADVLRIAAHKRTGKQRLQALRESQPAPEPLPAYATGLVPRRDTRIAARSEKAASRQPEPGKRTFTDSAR